MQVYDFQLLTISATPVFSGSFECCNLVSHLCQPNMVQTGSSVSQGCSLSPRLYIIYDGVMMKKATENVQEGT